VQDAHSPADVSFTELQSRRFPPLGLKPNGVFPPPKVTLALMQDGSAEIAYQQWVGRGADAVEAIAVALIVGYILAATVVWFTRSIRRRQFTLEHYSSFRAALGRAMLLGLEVLIAADVVRTAALEPTLRNFEALGVLVMVRTFLSWSIVVEIEGRWPWQRRIDESGGSGISKN
jgi:uncharacterized membrane protein